MELMSQAFTDPGPTTALTTTNSPQAIPAAVLNNGTKPVKRVIATVDTNAVRIGFGGVTVSTTLGHIIYPGDGFTLTSFKQANELRVISAETGIHGVIQFTGEH